MSDLETFSVGLLSIRFVCEKYTLRVENILLAAVFQYHELTLLVPF